MSTTGFQDRSFDSLTCCCCCEGQTLGVLSPFIRLIVVFETEGTEEEEFGRTGEGLAKAWGLHGTTWGEVDEEQGDWRSDL